jgi:hypothetical protein
MRPIHYIDYNHISKDNYTIMITLGPAPIRVINAKTIKSSRRIEQIINITLDFEYKIRHDKLPRYDFVFFYIVTFIYKTWAEYISNNTHNSYLNKLEWMKHLQPEFHRVLVAIHKAGFPIHKFLIDNNHIAREHTKRIINGNYEFKFINKI